jgi:hypothetical protein
MTPLPGGFEVDYRLLAAIKALIALAGFALLAWDWRLGAQAPPRWIRFRRRALAALGLLALAAWWNFGALHGAGRPLHLHDFFHYYVGSKYFRELGYTHLYQCMAVADVQRGHARDVGQRWTRNLDTNALERRLPTAAETDECRARLGPRWDEFSADLDWFRTRMRPRDWDGIPLVFGHNATPAWNAVGHWLTRAGPASDRQVLALALIDAILLVTLWVLLWRTFGWQAASVAALWWGLNGASAYSWIGGGFLRADGLLLLTAAVCALKTGRGFAAGLALGAAALLRAYPLFLVAGLGVKVLLDAHARGAGWAWQTWRGVIAGAAAGAALLLGLSVATWAGAPGGALEPWTGFATNSRKHLETPIRNHVGLKPAIWFDPATRGAILSRFWNDDPWDAWRDARLDTAARRAPLRYAITALFVVLFAFSVRRAPPWMALVASVALLPFVTTLANYYYASLLLFGVLWRYDRAIGVALAALTALSAGLPAVAEHNDDRYFILSVAIVIFAFLLAWRLPRAAAAETGEASAPPAVAPA